MQSRLDSLPWPGSGDAEQGRASIGPYRILEVLGEGGMGTVYKAEQREPVRRLVGSTPNQPLGRSTSRATPKATC